MIIIDFYCNFKNILHKHFCATMMFIIHTQNLQSHNKSFVHYRYLMLVFAVVGQEVDKTIQHVHRRIP